MHIVGVGFSLENLVKDIVKYLRKILFFSMAVVWMQCMCMILDWYLNLMLMLENFDCERRQGLGTSMYFLVSLLKKSNYKKYYLYQLQVHIYCLKIGY